MGRIGSDEEKKLRSRKKEGNKDKHEREKTRESQRKSVIDGKKKKDGNANENKLRAIARKGEKRKNSEKNGRK